MLRFLDGFDHYVVADLGLKWTSVLELGTVQPLSVYSGSFAIGSTGRNSSKALTMTPGSFTWTLRKGFDNQPSWVIGFAAKFGSLPTAITPLIRFMDGSSSQVEVSVNTGGKLCWTRGATLISTGTTTLSAGVFYYIECQVTISSSVSASTCIIQLNGVPELTLAGATNTRGGTTNNWANAIELVTLGNSAAYALVLDDLYVCDGTGSINNALLGDVRVEALFPTGVGSHADFTPSGGGSNYAKVNEVAEDGDTTYVSSSTVGQIDSYALASLSSTPSAIMGIQTVNVIRKDDAGTRSVAGLIRTSSTDYPGGTIGVGDSYASLLEIRELNPNGSVAWTPTVINTMEAGVKLVG